MNITNPWLTPYQRSYHQIKSKLISGLTSITYNGKQLITDVSEGNILVIIVSLFAAIAEVLHYYIDNAAREQFISTARRYDSVVKIGKIVDYLPSGASAARADLLISSSTTNTSNRTITAGTPITDSAGNIWQVVNDVLWPSGTYSVVVPIVQHERYDIENLVGTAISNISMFTIPSSNFTNALYEHGTMELTIDGVSWVLVDTFAHSKYYDRHFRVQVNSDRSVNIIFGDGNHGKKPALNSIIGGLSCYITMGSNGNIEAQAISRSNFIINGDVAVNPEAAIGGNDYESIEELRDSIPRYVRTNGVAVTKEDFEDLALQVPGVGKAKMEYICGRKMNLYIFPSGSSSITKASYSLCGVVYNKIKPYMPITTLLSVQPIGTSDIILDISVVGKKSYKADDIRTHIQRALIDTYNASASEIGGSVRISDLYSLIDNIISVDYLKINKFYIIPYFHPMNGGYGFSPYSYSMVQADKSINYYVTIGNTNATIQSEDGVYVKSINRVSVANINDTYHGVVFNLRLFQSSENPSCVVGMVYKFTVCKINDDFVDSGYSIPIFSKANNLTAEITESV